MLRYVIVFSALCIYSSTVGQTILPDGFHRTLVAENLNPTSMIEAPDGRIFMTQKDGRVLIVRDDELLTEPFVSLEVDSWNERGLGGIVLHPEFESNHFVYIFYTPPGKNVNRISRFTANGDLIIPGSEKILLETDELRAGIHNGGAMHFKADGKLYISTGEGGTSWKAPSLGTLLGKILRLNDDGSIPEDNPYYNELNGDFRAIWASGLRNSFSTSYDPETDRIFANDVGGGEYEEINVIEKGAFYGWDNLEGFRVAQELPSNYRDPLYAYSHDVGCAIVGSDFYKPETATFPEKYIGKYFFADYCKGWVKVLDPETGEVVEDFLKGGDRIVDLLTTRDGNIYYLERRGIGDGSPQDNSGTVDGLLWKIVYTGDGSPFIARQPKDALVSVGEQVRFSIDISGAGAITYTWFLDGQPIADSDSSVLTLSNVSIADSASKVNCVISNNLGTISSDTVFLYVTSNERPVITFELPAPDFTYIAGEDIEFRANVQDAEDGDLPVEDITWWIDFHHLDHTHPAVTFHSGPAEGAFRVPQIGEISPEVWYRIYVNAHDSRGMERTEYIDIYPELVTFDVQSQPEGLDISVDGAHAPTPVTVSSVKGIQRTLEAPVNQIRDGQIYFFERWGDDELSTIRTIKAGFDAQKYTAHYKSRQIGQGTGLKAEYFATRNLSGQPVFERIDTNINVNFYFDSPGPGIGEDMFSIRWTGFILPYESGVYNFIGIVNDGARLYIDEQLVFDNWDNIVSSAQLVGGSLYLEEGRLYKMRMEYAEYNWGASCQLRWASDFLKEEVIPTSQLYPAIEGDDFEINVHPNPSTSNKLQLSIRSDLYGVIPCRILDMTGREVDHFDLSIFPGEYNTPLASTNFLPGQYLLEIDRGGTAPQLVKFIIVN